MNERHYLLKGTFLLTVAGLLTRAAGFFYKIFLSRTIGAAEIGRFQLTFPVLAFCSALSCGGIQTAVSRFTAEYYAEKDQKSAIRILACALFLSITLSTVCCAALFGGSLWLATYFLLEPSCASLLQIIAFSLPFSAIHGCLNGFFIGKKNIPVSAASQLIEQLLRITAVMLFYMIFKKSGRTANANIMALGQLAGELAAALFCIYHLVFGKHQLQVEQMASPALSVIRRHSFFRLIRRDTKKTLAVSAPLGLSRMLLCVLQGIEAALLPQMLGQFGHSSLDALAVYGTLTGMALPLLMFPTAVTSAIGTLLLPAVSEARALNQDKKITDTINASFQGSLLLGYFFLTGFLLFGNDLGTLLFHSSLAGVFTRKLALLCPFVYINTTLISVLHGMGKTAAASVWNTAGFCVRLLCILFLVPDIGIDGYFIGMLVSQAFIVVCSLITLHRAAGFTASLTDALLKPALLCILCGAGLTALRLFCPRFSVPSWSGTLLLAVLFGISFLVPCFFLLPQSMLPQKLLHHSRLASAKNHGTRRS